MHGPDEPIRARKDRSIADISPEITLREESAASRSELHSDKTQDRHPAWQPSARLIAGQTACARSRRTNLRSKGPLHHRDVTRNYSLRSVCCIQTIERCYGESVYDIMYLYHNVSYYITEVYSSMISYYSYVIIVCYTKAYTITIYIEILSCSYDCSIKLVL